MSFISVVAAAAILKPMNLLELLAKFGLTGQVGPIYPGAILTDLATRLGPPWDIGRISKRHRWPHLFSYGDIQLVACRCRIVTHISIEVHRQRIELPTLQGGMFTIAPGQLTFEQIATALHEAQCRWTLHNDSPGSRTLRTQPAGAHFVFDTDVGPAPVLHAASVFGAQHQCPPIPPGQPDDGLGR
jgi:hypothetical protein